MSLPLCYSCGEPILRINQRLEGDVTYIEFFHKYGDACIDIIEPQYILDPKNHNYFEYLRNLTIQLNSLEPSK